MMLKRRAGIGGVAVLLGMSGVGHAAVVAENATDYTSNWSGYFAVAPSGSTFTDITSSWTVPTVSTAPASGTAFAATWLGLDGAVSGDGSVEQCGTTSQISSGGTTDYYAWYEFYPNAEVQIGSVLPGDSINAEVAYDGSSSGNYYYTIVLDDLTQNEEYDQEFYTNQAWQRSTAEWIAEAPSDSKGDIYPLADFGSVTFSNDTAALNGVADQSAESLGSTAIDMVQDNEVVAEAGEFDATGTSFTDHYVPEPASIGIMALAGLGLLNRPTRRRRSALV